MKAKTTDPTTQLIERVARRQRIDAFVHLAHRWLMLTTALMATLLLVARLTAWLPPVFGWPTLFAPPVLALLLATLLRRVSSTEQAARAIDRQVGDEDLFLTVCCLDSAPGEYQSVVLAQAERRAEQISATSVRPFDWGRPLGSAAVLMLMLIAGLLFLPQLDPFGAQQAREKQENRRKLFAAQDKATQARLALLKKKNVDATQSKEVAQAIEQLKNTLRMMKTDQQRKNVKQLNQNQRQLGKMWRAKQALALKRALTRVPAAQRFGKKSDQQFKGGLDGLKSGNASALRKRLKKLQQTLKRLKKKDPNARKKARKQLRKKIQQMKEALSQLNSDALNSALKKALERLANNTQGMSSEDLRAIEQALQQSELELEKLAQNMRDLKKLEKALRTLQLAKLLNGKKGLDGSLVQGLRALKEYEQLYRRLTQGPKPGQGKGTGGKKGGGGKVAEKPETKSDFITEMSKSTITAGKMLMQLKGSQRSLKAGKARENYTRSMKQVKQGVSEAILQEQVPPGYHDSIKKYFDTLGKTKPTGKK